jgi:hypothetical protein
VLILAGEDLPGVSCILPLARDSTRRAEYLVPAVGYGALDHVTICYAAASRDTVRVGRGAVILAGAGALAFAVLLVAGLGGT